MHQWGPRCLAINLKASESATLGISGKIIRNQEDDSDDSDFTVPYFRQRFYPEEKDEDFIFLVNIGFHDFTTGFIDIV